MQIMQANNNIPQYVRVEITTHGKLNNGVMTVDDINTYAAAGMLFQTAIPDLSIGFSQQQKFECSPGMSLFGIQTECIDGRAFIVQTSDGKFRDFDYETYGHILHDIANWGTDEKNPKKVGRFPRQAPALGTHTQ